MPVAEVKILPVGTDDPSISSYIRDCYEVAQTSDRVDVAITPTSTIIEGELNDIWDVVHAMHQIPFFSGVDRVITTLTIDERQDKYEDMEDMVASVIEEDDY